MMTVLSPPVHEEPRLAADALSIDLIRRGLRADSIGYEIHLFRELLSTNDALRTLAESGAPGGTVVLSETQHAGRGHFGTTWVPPERANLYASVLLRPKLPRRAARAFTFTGLLALADAIAAEGAEARVRWPNEVLIGGRKVAETVCSVAPMGEIADYVIIGVEVNLIASHEPLGGAHGPASALVTSLREAVGRPIDRNRFAASFLNSLERWLGIYWARGVGAVLVAWKDRDVLRGRVVEVRAAKRIHRGRVAGVDEEGRLVLEQGAGVDRAVVSGELVTVD